MREMSFHRPRTVEEAVEVLADNPEAHCLAGGATLVVMMNAHLLAPEALVSLAEIEELERCERLSDGSVRIGAMRCHRQTALESDLGAGHKVVSEAACRIGNPAVQNMGTIGGSIAFADPAGDYAPALMATDAVVEVAGRDGRREVPVADFFVDAYTTVLAAGEIVTAVRLPPAPAGSVGRFEKLELVTGDYAITSVAVVLEMNGSHCEALRIAVGACTGTSMRLLAMEARLAGGTLDSHRVTEAREGIVSACEIVDDMRATAEYRRMVLPRLIARAVEHAKMQSVQSV